MTILTLAIDAFGWFVAVFVIVLAMYVFYEGVWR
jgi:hypothetical protein